MMYQVLVAKTAEKNFRKFPAAVQKRIKNALQSMTENPYDGDVVKLRGNHIFRRRVGSYRIFFTVHNESVTVFIIDIRKRDDRTYSDM